MRYTVLYNESINEVNSFVGSDELHSENGLTHNAREIDTKEAQASLIYTLGHLAWPIPNR